jgi:NAD(P)-dependent dehydrogenase (short-subunit alcohol dehydrogenase family)
VNNAGIGKATSVETVELADYDAIMNTNVRAPMFLTKYALPHLIASRGNVVNISSISDRGAVGETSVESVSRITIVYEHELRMQIN